MAHQDPRVAPWTPCLPRGFASPVGNINHRVDHRSYINIYLLFSTLFSYENNLDIDRIILMNFSLTLPIDNLFEVNFNNRK